MSFISNLTKGFIKSAVNQVGRDGGKVISNNLYNNQNTTQVNITSTESSDSSNNTNTQLFEEKEYIWVKFFWATLICMIPYIGILFIIYRAIINLTTKEITLYKYEDKAIYKSDRRYSTGVRFEGFQRVKVSVKVPIDETNKKRKKFKAIGYIIICVLWSIIFNNIIAK